MTFWDYKTGLPFQTMADVPQPGSLDAEAGIFASAFDQTGSRLITACADKSVKIYKGAFSSLINLLPTRMDADCITCQQRSNNVHPMYSALFCSLLSVSPLFHFALL